MSDGRAGVDDRVRVRRIPDRGRYDRETVYSILDAGVHCHVGYVVSGEPYVTPTAYWRDGDFLYWHGSSASRMLRTLAGGVGVCVAVTHVDGIVLARAAFHHSMNYRSVMAFGTAEVVQDADEKLAALRSFTEWLVPGRWSEVRHPTPLELKATVVLRMALDQASAKIREGPPIDDEADYASPFWAGVVPLTTIPGAAIPDPRLAAGIPTPASISGLRRG
jgi:hypothetical protein